MFSNKDRVYCNGKGYGTFISYGINSREEAIVKFDNPNEEENEFGYHVVSPVLLKAEDEVYTSYRLSSIFDKISGEKMLIKDMIGKNFTFRYKDLQIGNKLSFRMVDEPFGFRDMGEIISIEDKVMRKRDYKIVSTEDKEYYLLEHKRK